MALCNQDYWCEICGQVLLDVKVVMAIGAQASAPSHCDQRMTWLPGTRGMDIGGVKGASFKGFHTTDGRGQPVHIDSFHKLRQVEREAEQAYRNGEGQPMVFRHAAQDASNRDQPTLSKSYYGGEAPTPAAAHRFGSTAQRSAEAPETGFGPGVSESNASALPMAGGE